MIKKILTTAAIAGALLSPYVANAQDNTARTDSTQTTIQIDGNEKLKSEINYVSEQFILGMRETSALSDSTVSSLTHEFLNNVIDRFEKIESCNPSIPDSVSANMSFSQLTNDPCGLENIKRDVGVFADIWAERPVILNGWKPIELRAGQHIDFSEVLNFDPTRPAVMGVRTFDDAGGYTVKEFNLSDTDIQQVSVNPDVYVQGSQLFYPGSSLDQILERGAVTFGNIYLATLTTESDSTSNRYFDAVYAPAILNSTDVLVNYLNEIASQKVALETENHALRHDNENLHQDIFEMYGRKQILSSRLDESNQELGRLQANWVVTPLAGGLYSLNGSNDSFISSGLSARLPNSNWSLGASGHFNITNNGKSNSTFDVNEFTVERPSGNEMIYTTKTMTDKNLNQRGMFFLNLGYNVTDRFNLGVGAGLGLGQNTTSRTDTQSQTINRQEIQVNQDTFRYQNRVLDPVLGASAIYNFNNLGLGVTALQTINTGPYVGFNVGWNIRGGQQ